MSRNGLKNKVLESLEETRSFGKQLGSQAKENDVFCFFGGLGAGKTTLIKAFCQSQGVNPINVSSPTFSYLNIYQGHLTIYHFDLYRLENEKQFLALGFQEYLFAGGIVCIEWSEKILPLLNHLRVIKVFVEIASENHRLVEVEDGSD